MSLESIKSIEWSPFTPQTTISWRLEYPYFENSRKAAPDPLQRRCYRNGRGRRQMSGWYTF